MIRRIIMLAMIAIPLACTGRASSTLAEFSTISSERPVEIYVLRNKNLTGSGGTRKVFLDGWALATLGIGQYVRFYVAEGSHSIGTNQSSVSFDFVDGGEPYFFIISPDGANWGTGGFEIERIASAPARKALGEYSEVR